MTIVHKAVTRLTLDLQLGDVQKSFGLTKGDRNRRLEITFTDGGRPFELPSKWVVWLLATKPDGARVEMPCVVEHGRATFDLEDGYELATCPGMFAVWFKILADTGEDVAGPAVWCYVKDGPGEVESLSQDGIDEYLLGMINANAEDIAENRGDIDLLMETTDNLGEAQNKLQETVRAHGETIDAHTEQLASDLRRIERLETASGRYEDFVSNTYPEEQEVIRDRLTAAETAVKDNTESLRTISSLIPTLATPAQINSAISAHNEDAAAHPYLRSEIERLSQALSNFLNVSDTSRDQLSEVLALIENNAENIAKFEEILASGGGSSGGGSSAPAILSGTVTIPVSTWSDDSPTSSMTRVEGLVKGVTALLYPADEATKIAAASARLTAKTTGSAAAGESGIFYLLRAEAASVPLIDLTFRYLLFSTANKDDAPAAALIGVDAVGEQATKESVGLGNVANERQYSANNPPPYPVTSVNGQTGTVDLDASDVGARPDTWMPTATDTGADEAGTAQELIDRLAASVAQDLAGYYAKSETYSRTEIDSKISAIPKFAIEVVSSLPTSNISSTTVYLVKDSTEGGGLYTEYIRVNGAWEILGNQTVDLSGYVTSEALTEALKNLALKSEIPTKLSQLEGDSTHRTVTDTQIQDISTAKSNAATALQKVNAFTSETWTFTLKSGSTVTKKVVTA